MRPVYKWPRLRLPAAQFVSHVQILAHASSTDQTDLFISAISTSNSVVRQLLNSRIGPPVLAARFVTSSRHPRTPRIDPFLALQAILQ
jgi:hypothetical protein